MADYRPTKYIRGSAGWSYVALPIELDTNTTASDFCTLANNQGNSLTEIDRFHAGDWQGHICGLPFANFALEPGTGYFVKANTSWHVSLEGTQFDTPFTIPLTPGWNSISVPNRDTASASQLCSEIESQGGTPQQIIRFIHGGWEGHHCDQAFNDFTLKPGEGHFVRANSSSELVLQP